MKRSKLLFLAILCSISSTAQVFTPGFSATAEAYFGYDFNKPFGNLQPVLFVNHHRVNQVAINTIQVEMGHQTADEKARFKLALMAGSYSERNLAFEPPAMKNLAEAYVGIRLGKVWVDMGVFNSHIGAEGVKAVDNDMLTRTLLAENSPYYESGVRALLDREHWRFGLFVLNGWQQIARQNWPGWGLSGGTQVQWHKGAFVLNSSTFVGRVLPNVTRFYHDFWGSWTSPSERHKLTVAADIGLQYYNFTNSPSDLRNWWGASATYRLNLGTSWSAFARAEAFIDPDVLLLPSPSGLRFVGAAAGAEYRITDNAFVRAEYRYLLSDRSVFPGTTTLPNSNLLYSTTSKQQYWVGLLVAYRIPTIPIFNRLEPRSN